MNIKKKCSTYKNNDTHLKQPVLIRQMYLKTICIKVWKFIMTHESQTISFRPWVDSQTSHGSDIPIGYFMMLEFTQKQGSLLLIFQVENSFRTLCLKIKEGKAYTSFSVNRRASMNFVFYIFLRWRVRYIAYLMNLKNVFFFFCVKFWS